MHEQTESEVETNSQFLEIRDFFIREKTLESFTTWSRSKGMSLNISVEGQIEIKYVNNLLLTLSNIYLSINIFSSNYFDKCFCALDKCSGEKRLDLVQSNS